MLKRSFDLCGACILLMLSLPVITLIALAIVLTSDGPVIFRQRRLGLKGIPFTIFKFRTLVHDYSGPFKFVTADDPRVTPIGRFLRSSHLDELPQLVNVLRGEMSLVGPRPHSLEHFAAMAAVEPSYIQRLAVKPGLTGLAQIKGPKVLDPETGCVAFELDTEYMKRSSLWSDIRILCRTIPEVFSHRSF